MRPRQLLLSRPLPLPLLLPLTLPLPLRAVLQPHNGLMPLPCWVLALTALR